MTQVHEVLNDDHGDIERYDAAAHGYVAASLSNWRAFYIVRGLAQWANEWPEAFTVPVWLPSGGSWDDLEWLLYERWGSITSRWWEDTTPRPRQPVVHPPALSQHPRKAKKKAAHGAQAASPSSAHQLSLL